MRPRRERPGTVCRSAASRRWRASYNEARAQGPERLDRLGGVPRFNEAGRKEPGRRAVVTLGQPGGAAASMRTGRKNPRRQVAPVEDGARSPGSAYAGKDGVTCLWLL